MPVNLKGRSLLTLKDYTPEEILYLLSLANELRAKKHADIPGDRLRGRSIVLIFDKPSTRTRCAFEVACFDEGGTCTYLSNSQMGKKESLEDTARVLGRYYDGIQYRGFSQKIAEDLALYAGVPVYNGLTDQYHPTQALADILTLMENTTKPLSECKLAYVGDARSNTAHSLMIIAAKLGMAFAAIAPHGLTPDRALLHQMNALAKETGARIEVSQNLSAVAGADAIYTDVWFSMGEEAKAEERIALLAPYRVTESVMGMTGNPNTIFLHCLPSFHDMNTEIGMAVYEKHGIKEMEVEDRVFRAPYSKVFDQAENRLHTIKAVLVATIGRNQ